MHAAALPAEEVNFHFGHEGSLGPGGEVANPPPGRILLLLLLLISLLLLFILLIFISILLAFALPGPQEQERAEE